ncbi:type 1 glutamine amidotransferase [Agromyces archimandritae]|uniref:Type 1 glutamine amidotransferase n=1 Tax=Agromyces archimandritae TaxID=2781962 RepID=A0A975IQC5_9MICO|nr:type 1 glutamine amidotransferase [Agromyces archimandritae]
MDAAGGAAAGAGACAAASEGRAAASAAPPRVLVVQNSPSSGPRRLAGWLEEAGLDLEVRHGADGLPASIAGYAGLVMLGGGFMPDDLARAPWLAAERALAAEAIAADLPTLGICLGGQLLADVAGGQVRAAHGMPERGATEIRATDAGAADAVIGALAPAAHVIENHQDMITALPAGAVLLASSAACEVQAFRLGRHVRGLQFHPEAGAEDLLRWDEAALSAEGISRDSLVDAARAVEPDSAARCAALAAAFAAEVRAA